MALDQSETAPAPQAESPAHAPAPAPAYPADQLPADPQHQGTQTPAGLDALTSKLDEQFARLADAVGDVRHIAQTSASEQADLRETVAHLQARIDDPSASLPANNPTGPSLDDLSGQIRAVQDAIGAMPKPEAIQSLEEGYNHVLTRLDELKTDGTPNDKIDALYAEVSGLRHLLDGLDQGNPATMVDEMRAMIARLESNAPNGRDGDANGGADRITEALEAVKAMAAGQDPAFINEAIGAVVERLVALEARIEALASGADDNHVTQRLDAIQSEMARLSTFQEEARGMTSALDAIRDEMRTASPTVDLSSMDERFSALDRIEQMTGGYATQVASLSERLNGLDGALANQGEIAREVALLSQQMGMFKSTLPVHEIEQTLLDLTGRVVALQEDTSAERLGLAVRELGERVESCLKSIPRTEAIVQAVEEKIDGRFVGVVEPMMSRLDTVDARLDSIQKAISDDDAPLIEKMSQRLEGLIAAMPTPVADEAISSLEKQLEELTARYSNAGMVSREDVLRLNNELTRARASVELGSNRDLQRAIVDQVRHLADRFDTARASGDAALLPEIEVQIEGLAGRVQSLGLFEQDVPSAAPTMAGSDVDLLQSELVSLRESASDQDQRMHSTLESVQTALETVIRRISVLEADDKATAKLAEQSLADNGGMPSSLQQVRQALATSRCLPEPMPTADLAPDASTLEDEPADLTPPSASAELAEASDFASKPKTEEAPGAQASPEASLEAEPETGPEAGDAQTLLRQLSGALDAVSPPPPAGSDQASAFGVPPVSMERLADPAATSLPPRTPRATRRAQARATSPTNDPQVAVEAASQRANFIAAARRAAQAAALQASGGKSPATSVTRSGPQGLADDNDRVEPTVAEVLAGTSADKSALQGAEHTLAQNQPDADATGSPSSSEESEQAQYPETPMHVLGQTAKTARQEQAEKKTKEEKRQKVLSRAMLVALVLFTVGIGLFVVNLILPNDRGPNTVIAPLATQDPAVDVTPEDDGVATAPAEAVRAVGPEASVATAVEDGVPQDRPVEQSALEQPVLDDGVADSAVGTGFERDRGPVMAQTPQPNAETQDVASQLPPPANDLGPLLNLPIPALPQATADSLPEAIGAPRLRVAAAGGDPAAQFEVATRFMEGRFVPQDLAAAAHWYGRAADQGVVPAAYRIGSFYEQGRGVDRDRDAAIAWYERAALGGNPRAMHNLAVMAAEGTQGSAPDFARAAGWFIPAANRGLADSQFNLAVLFARGMGVERDLMESYKWFSLAANAGDNEAVARRDEVAGVLGEQALALANARVDNWLPVPVETLAVSMPAPEGGWDDAPVQAGNSVAPTQAQVAEVQTLLSQRGYDPGPADGLIGPRTTDAVRAFRQSAGLNEGVSIDQALLDALRAGTSL
jgi:localization factor PodJL